MRMMWIVVITALVLCVLRVIQGHYIMASFLGFLSLITAHPLWYGAAVLNYKKGINADVIRIRRGLLWATFIYGTALVVWSIILNVQGVGILMMIFGLLGMVSGRKAWWSDRTFEAGYNWLIEHVDGMVTTGIAAYTAFFAFGGRTLLASLLQNEWQVIPWVLPTVIGVIIIRRMKARYRAQPAV